MSKRTRRQREYRDILTAAGFEAWTPDATMYGDNDIYNLYDILAAGPGALPRLIQVSTNANGRLDWFKDAYRHYACGFIVEYAQVYANEGWRVMRPVDDSGEWVTVYDGRDDGERMGEGVTAWLRGDVGERAGVVVGRAGEVRVGGDDASP